jgi:ectoine hydroxylase-related dioxygenase (phytanoyl-CoA dioxygenase family)
MTEMERWSDYMAGEVDRHGVQETRFMAHRGDLLLWDAWLLHGGSEITSPGRTRHSLITHYFTRSDCERSGATVRPAEGGSWMVRAPQSVPGEDPGQTQTLNRVALEATYASERTPNPPSDVQPRHAQGPTPRAPRSLRDSFDELDDMD